MQVDEHPLFRMWKDRSEKEAEQAKALATRRAEREAERVVWYTAWQEYKAHAGWTAPLARLPRWWNVPGWIRWLLRLHAPGRPN